MDAIFLPTPYQGYKGVRAGLLADTYLEGMRIVQHKKSYADYVLTPEILAEIEKAARDRDIYTRMAKSIAPEVSFHAAEPK
jgi:DNA replication licensing factor MCM7